MNAVARKLEGFDSFQGRCGHCRIDFRGGNGNAVLNEINPVETLRIVDQRCVTLGSDPVNNIGNCAINIFRYLALR
jgi:hypothetical protein